MEKWKTKGKKIIKTESVLPPTRRSPSPTTGCTATMEKKKDRKWSFGGLLRRISSGQNNDASSNEEDITYIPGHMLSKKNIKKTSKMKSKLGRIPSESPSDLSTPNEKSCTSKDTPESTRSSQSAVRHFNDSLVPCNNDSVNSRSSEGSLDATGKSSRMNRMKARAQAKRDRLCVKNGSSSDDDDDVSHKSNQSLRFRSDENMESIQQRTADAASSRRTRGARTERYIKRMYRDDVTSGSESKIIAKPVPLPRSVDPTTTQHSSNSVDSNSWQTGSTPSIVVASSRALRQDERNLPHGRESLFDARYLRDMNENVTHEPEKRTWPHDNFRKSAPINEIRGSPRSRSVNVATSRQRLVPPEPPPRSSKSRIFNNVYRNTSHASDDPSHDDFRDIFLDRVTPGRLPILWQNSDSRHRPSNMPKSTGHTGNEENAPVAKDRREFPIGFYERCSSRRNDHCNSLDRTRRSFNNTAIRPYGEYSVEQENYDPRPYFVNATPPTNNYARSTCSLPKGVQLFSRQRLSHCDESEGCLRFSDEKAPPAIAEPPADETIIPKLRKSREIQCPSVCSNRSMNSDEAERKRSSKNLEEALTELEAIYNSLRLSDDDLLERAEQRSMDEYRDKAARNAAVANSLKSCSDASSNEKDDNSLGTTSSRREIDHRMKDDMAYRRMNPKDRPPSVNGQASLSNISYLATSPNLSVRENDYCDPSGPRSRRETPDLTRDDLLYRSISHANNTLKVIEPQPPFGIPLGPVTTANESDYLHVKPSKFGQTRSLYIPKTEPDVVSDDLAFRNLRKDPTRDSSSVAFNNKNTNLFIQNDALNERPLVAKSTFVFGNNKKRAVRSMSADLYGIVSKETDKRNSDWYNDYIKSTQKLRFASDNGDPSLRRRSVDEENFNGNMNVKNIATNALKIVESSNGQRCPSDNDTGLDINGNRPKSALQRKIQVYVPRDNSHSDEAKQGFSSKSREGSEEKIVNLLKLNGTESENSSLERCDSRLSVASDNARVPRDKKDKPIESFLEHEITEYMQLCKDLEKLLQQTAELEDTVVATIGNVDEQNSQSEFDELEKLLIDDYELPVSSGPTTIDVTVVDATSTEREEDDGSSSRSIGLSSDNIQSSPTRIDRKFVDDDAASSTSELGNSSSNTGSSFNESVYDKFNQLLREVNDVPYVQPKNTIKKYPTDEQQQQQLTSTSEIIHDNEISNVERSDSAVDGNSINFFGDQSTSRILEQTQGSADEVIDPTASTTTTNLYEEKLAKHQNDVPIDQPNLRIRNGGTRETGSRIDDAKSSYREG